MLLWLSLSLALALTAAVAAGILAMRRADQRARRNLYLSLGYGEDLVVALMGQKGPVSAQLAVVRKTSILTPPRPEEAPTQAQARPSSQRSFQYTRALNGTRTPHERAAPGADGRRNPPPN